MFLFSQLIFYLSLAFLIFLPGYLFLQAAVDARKKFSALEQFVFSFGFGIVVTDLLMLLLGKTGITLNRISLIVSVTAFSAVCLIIWKLRFKESWATFFSADKSSFFSSQQIILILFLIFLSVFTRTIYAKDTILPTTTDLGHHMYWAQRIDDSGKIPAYEKQDIVENNGEYGISLPQPIADFIIGEHLIFSAVGMVTGQSYLSSFPAIILLLTNLMGILAYFLLALRLFEDLPYGKNAAILTLLFLGPLYAISPPQAKYALGGVVGNMIGNLLLPLIVYFFVAALRKNRSSFLALAGILTLGLFYTHHLTAFIFLFVLFAAAVLFSVLNSRSLPRHIREWAKIIFSPSVISVAMISAAFLFVIYTPSYIDTGAVKTVARAPSKVTREGLTFTNLMMSVGEIRMALGLLGLVTIFFLDRFRKQYAAAFIGGWTIILLLMILAPTWIRIDIPSIRVASYVSFPLSILGALALAWLFFQMKNVVDESAFRFLPYAFGIIFAFIFMNGSLDNAGSLRNAPNFQDAVQTYRASQYLARNTGADEAIVKDHNYLVADAWIKIFFMRDYNFPFTRGFFTRYEDQVEKREPCTLRMISTPDTSDATRCFTGTNTRFVMVNPSLDSVQFEELKNFWEIYSSNHVNIYYRAE